MDTNVWFPVSIADLILRCIEDGMFDLAWSDESFAELERVLVEVKRLSPLKAAVFIHQIKNVAPAGRVDPKVYKHLVGGISGLDPDDHVLSAAVQGGRVTVLLTENLRDFPQVDLGRFAKAQTPDDFFSGLAGEFPLEFVELISRMSAHLKNPPVSELGVLDRLEKNGMPEFSALMRDQIT